MNDWVSHQLLPTPLCGRDVIKNYVKTLPHSPGVYRMLGAEESVLYVGKAKDLKKRVQSYLRIHLLPRRLQRMVNETISMEFITTQTEVEALLVEAQLIKHLSPRYNILLRDDKSYGYIGIQKKHPFPEVARTRRKNTQEWELFGPFASTMAMKNTLIALQKAFKLRSCSDSFYNARKRPCLQYDIKRCSAPCVGYIDQDAYKQSIQSARDVLCGRTQEVQQALTSAMHMASEARQYERALIYRDQIRALSYIQTEQSMPIIGHMGSTPNADFFAIVQMEGLSCVQVMFYRNDRYYGNRSLFPKHDKDTEIKDVWEGLLLLFYQNLSPPKDIFVNMEIAEKELIEEALSQLAGYQVNIHQPQRGKKKEILQHTEQNARDALSRKLSETTTIRTLHAGVAEAFGMAQIPQRIEVYDNSHIQGAHATGAMIVATLDGFEKGSYRRFNMSLETASNDDFEMMRSVMRRRFAHRDAKNFTHPDLMLIDGGLGQLNAVLEVLDELNIQDITIVAIAKGKARIAGEERFFMRGRGEFCLEKTDPVFYYIQRLRDEAHRFAITTHRQKRAKALNKSLLEDIPQVGSRRKHLLLKHFGSAKAVTEASLNELEKVEGISKELARSIYIFFHGQ